MHEIVRLFFHVDIYVNSTMEFFEGVMDKRDLIIERPIHFLAAIISPMACQLSRTESFLSSGPHSASIWAAVSGFSGPF